MRTSLLKLSLIVSTRPDMYSEGMKWRPPSGFSKGSELLIDELTLVTGEDCTAGLDLMFPEAPDPIRHFLYALFDTLLWIY